MVCTALYTLPRIGLAEEYYVTPTGVAPYTGENWANAFSNLQDAATMATNAGDKIYLQSGVYSHADQIMISNADGLTIQGGCYGGPAANSNQYSDTNSTLTRGGGVMRILYATNSTLTLEGLTISGGSLNNGQSGAGMYLGNCSVIITNCVIQNNATTNQASDLYGGGIYFNGVGRTLEIVSSTVASNTCDPANNWKSAYGGGIYFSGGSLVLHDLIFDSNTAIGAHGANGQGGAFCCSSVSNILISDTVFQRNRTAMRGVGTSERGCAVYLSGAASGVVHGCTFSNNYTVGGGALEYGAGICAESTGLLQITYCTFKDNYARGSSARGGAVYRSGGLLEIEDSTFDGNYCSDSDRRGSAVYLSGAAVTARISRCEFDGIGPPDAIVAAGQIQADSSAGLGMSHCSIQNSFHPGIYCAGGRLALTNCLVAMSGGDGLYQTTGSIALVNCTLADNAGWGLKCDGGVGTVLNCIAWGNASGGISSNSNLTVTYSCSQSPVSGGNSNLDQDPLFIYNYYLSVAGLPAQAVDSPCVNAGSGSPADYGLTNRTTRTDGAFDVGAVDMGWHYTNGLADQSVLSNQVLYVDAGLGNDANTGWTVAAPLKTLTHALDKIMRDGTIHVATGTYSWAANGEVFPLTVQKPNLVLLGTNRKNTVIDAAQSNRVLGAFGKGDIRLECLTFKNGRLYASYSTGIGLYFAGCSPVVVSNCAVRDSYISGYSYINGGGIYYVSAGGRLEIIDSIIATNIINSGEYFRGAGVYFSGNELYLNNAEFTGNRLTSHGSSGAFGGGLFCSAAASVIITNSCFEVNRTDSGRYGRGGAIDLSGAAEVVISDTRFIANYVNGSTWGYHGGCISAANTGPLRIEDCVFSNNYLNMGWACAGLGGAIYRAGGPLEISDSSFYGNYCISSSARRGGALYLTGAAVTARISRCRFDTSAVIPNMGEMLVAASSSDLILVDSTIANATQEGIYFSGSSLALTNTSLANSRGVSIYCAGATQSLVNCLVSGTAGDGVFLAAGTLAALNCTLADNVGWGINCTDGTGTVMNCIAWGNVSGGIASNESLSVTYSCSQSPVYGGISNLDQDPLFIYNYYLSVAGLPAQAVDSPCVNAGSGSPADYGLTNRTTRTDGAFDVGAVDMGWHYTNGLADQSVLSNQVLYVDAGLGNDANTGWTVAAPLKTLTHALDKIMRDGTIHVATGTYSWAANGEVFPLTVQKPNLVLLGTNRKNTVIDAAQSNRVLGAFGKGDIRLECLTFKNGRLYASYSTGIGLYFAGCSPVVVSNCAVRDSYISGYSYINGGGIYYVSAGGRLEIIDSIIATNIINSGEYFRGAGVYFSGNELYLNNAEFTGNRLTSHGSSGAFGGGLFCSAAASVIITNSCFEVNRTDSGRYGRGGAIDLSGAAEVVISDTRFIANYVNGSTWGYHGGCISAANTGPLRIEDCVFSNNYLNMGWACAGLGGAIYRAGGPLEISDSSFSGNYCISSDNPRGGALYLTGAAVTAQISRCDFDSSAVAANRGETIAAVSSARLDLTDSEITRASKEGVYFSGGVLTMTNCLVAAGTNDGLKVIVGSSAAAVNCTFANNYGWGITNAGVLTVKNSIAWGNGAGGVRTNATTTISYTDSQELLAGAGNMSQDPLFVDPAIFDYHLKSLAGSWHDGSWTNDAQMSPCIDAGEPAPGSSYALEPKPNGGRVNMGAYGNTARASRSSRGTVIRVW